MDGYIFWSGLKNEKHTFLCGICLICLMQYTLSFIVLITDGLYEQIIPQSVCSRYGLAIGSTVAPFVRVLVWICFPVAYPISKVITVFS